MNEPVRFFNSTLADHLEGIQATLPNKAFDIYLVSLLLADDTGKFSKVGFVDMAAEMLETGTIHWERWEDDGEILTVVEWEPHQMESHA